MLINVPQTNNIFNRSGVTDIRDMPFFASSTIVFKTAYGTRGTHNISNAAIAAFGATTTTTPGLATMLEIGGAGRIANIIGGRNGSIRITIDGGEPVELTMSSYSMIMGAVFPLLPTISTANETSTSQFGSYYDNGFGGAQVITGLNSKATIMTTAALLTPQMVMALGCPMLRFNESLKVEMSSVSTSKGSVTYILD